MDKLKTGILVALVVGVVVMVMGSVSAATAKGDVECCSCSSADYNWLFFIWDSYTGKNCDCVWEATGECTGVTDVCPCKKYGIATVSGLQTGGCSALCNTLQNGGNYHITASCNGLTCTV